MTLVFYFSPVPLSGLLPRALPFSDGCLVPSYVASAKRRSGVTAMSIRQHVVPSAATVVTAGDCSY